MISSFVEKKKDQLVIGSYYCKIKELYSILELCESFDNVFEYLKKRFIAIKSIHNQSDQFTTLVSNLGKDLKSTEEKYINLIKHYDGCVASFEEYQRLLDEVNKIDEEIKLKISV